MKMRIGSGLSESYIAASEFEYDTVGTTPGSDVVEFSGVDDLGHNVFVEMSLNELRAMLEDAEGLLGVE